LRRILAALGLAVLFSGLPLQVSTAAAATPANHFTWGQCTWWAANVRPDIGSVVFGYARQWTWSAQQAGLNTGTQPALNAIAVYQPGVQGAWAAGHVAHVIGVDPDGVHFTVDEMDYPIPGVVTQRVSQVGPGVEFIY
jgi:surface antigen